MLDQVMTRRQALRRAAGVAAAFGLLGASPARAAAALPDPAQSGIEHIVVLMMENRSFDHLLGWLPEHDGMQAGLQYADSDGVMHATHALAPDFAGCGFHDPDHSFLGGRIEYNAGACDGWLRAGRNDVFSIGYYGHDDLPFLGIVASTFATPARYFAAILGPTFPNRIYQHAAQTDRLSNISAMSTLPTIWDRLSDAGVSGGYYYNDLSFLGLWGTKYQSLSQPFPAFLDAAANGTLPAVSFVDPVFSAEASGPANDDHPLHDIRDGEAFMNSVYSAVTTGPLWPNTVFVINFDEWGGFYDHIPPPAGPVTLAEQALGYSDGLRGFRVPCIVISPWSQTAAVSRTVYDHTSVLKLIEWRFGLPPLTDRDAQANNLAELLDFSSPRLDVPQPSVAPAPYGGAC